ncbi:acyl carrier protein [Erythrobacter insulae]|uniref:Acyl carrier protein n=1 Tax=Erythrobacter insulae TaxID=2584124 RepID=A0A547PBU5_9SPHN|nr:acyl carrier protein [Erythrobacter insulae]TRD11606.1 acyl carrier protein [Erythrobacter insulae]
MKRADARSVILEEIESIAPDVAPVSIGDDEDIREALDLDSMDIFNLIAALHLRLNVAIPDRDVAQFVTIGGGAAWLADNIRSA